MRIVTAMPAVNPMVMVPGMKRISLPRRSTPMTISRMPAMTVATIRPCSPELATMPATMVANAAVGPAICTLLPPNAEIRKPAMMAVYRPSSGPTPDASASAMESGSAMTATMMPETMSEDRSLAE